VIHQKSIVNYVIDDLFTCNIVNEPGFFYQKLSVLRYDFNISRTLVRSNLEVIYVRRKTIFGKSTVKIDTFDLEKANPLIKMLIRS
jgi:hypothetical protein